MHHRIYIVVCMFIMIGLTGLTAQSESDTVPPPVPEEMSHEDVSFYAVIGGQQSGPYHWDDLMTSAIAVVSSTTVVVSTGVTSDMGSSDTIVSSTIVVVSSVTTGVSTGTSVATTVSVSCTVS